MSVEVRNAMSEKQPFVTIKGKKDGLILSLDDTCAYNELLAELKEKLAASDRHQKGPLISVKVKAGNRYLTDKQKQEIKEFVRSKKKLFVAEIESNVMSKQEADELVRQNQITQVTKMIRSGQVLEIDGDLLLIGDVNPGGRVIATGHIYVLGALRGMAHAGRDGRVDAVIAASIMQPTQLRIAEVVSRAPDQSKLEEHEMECAYVDDSNGQIVLDRIQSLYRLRPDLTRL